MDFNHQVHLANSIIHEVSEELGFPNDQKLGARLLRSVLHALRSRLTIQESFHLMAQLPIILKGMYVDSWKYQEKPKRLKSTGDFIREVIHEDGPLGHYDITTAKDGENIIRAVFKVLRRHISEGEIHDIMAILPLGLRSLWGVEVPPQSTGS